MRGDKGMDFEGGDRIDAVIDAALRSYAEPGEVPEARVFLARVMERARGERERGSGWWFWGAVVAACLAMAVVLGIWMMRGQRVPEIARVPRAPGVVHVATAIGSAKSAHPGALKAAHRDGAPGILVVQERLPKLEVFPAPRPLTREEQALVVFAAQVPTDVKVQVLEAEKHVGDPIAIAELKIAPLESGVVQDSKAKEKDKER